MQQQSFKESQVDFENRIQQEKAAYEAISLIRQWDRMVDAAYAKHLAECEQAGRTSDFADPRASMGYIYNLLSQYGYEIRKVK